MGTIQLYGIMQQLEGQGVRGRGSLIGGAATG